MAETPKLILPDRIITIGASPGPVSLALEPPALPAKAHYMHGVRIDSALDNLLGQNAGHWTGGGWTNNITGLGSFGRDKVLQGSYQESFRIDDPQLSALINGNDIAQRIVWVKPREMMRRGWVLVVPAVDKDGTTPTSAPSSAGEAQQPQGESGPAAPGAPLVDPLGTGNGGLGTPQTAPKDSASAPKDYSDPMGETLAKGVAPPKPADGTKPSPAAAVKKAAKNAKGADQPDGKDISAQLEAYATRLQLKPRCLEGLGFGRGFGGGLLVIGADDGADMATPLDETKIKSIRYLTWIDRRFIFASTWYAEIGPKYGEVQTWEIVNPFGGAANTRVHETRVVRFDGAPVDFLMRRRLLGWTLSVLQAPYDTMRQFDQSFQSISNLMADMSQAVLKMNGLMQMISNDQATLQTRMQMVDMSRSSGRMIYLDAENEEFNREPTPLTGVADTLEMQMLRLAAAAEMPVAILFGREPSGLNATGDADFRRFYDTIAGEQKNVLEPKLLRIYTLICLAKDGPTGGVLPAKGLEFVWHKLYEPSELEQSTIRWNMAQADDKYIANGTLLPEEVAKSRFASGDLHLDTEIITDLRDKALDTAELAPSGAAKQEADAQQAKDLIKAKGDAAPAKGPPGKGKPRTDSDDTTDVREDAWETARYDSATDDVYDLMCEDFPEEAIQWVYAAPWRGPTRIPMSQIDFANRAKWQASQPGEDADKVRKFAELLVNGGKLKPIVIVQGPRGKAIIVDGHHRALAYESVGDKSAVAYVARVNTQKGPWDETHASQRGGRSGEARADAEPVKTIDRIAEAVVASSQAVVARLDAVCDRLATPPAVIPGPVVVEPPFAQRNASFLADIKEQRELGFTPDIAELSRLHNVPVPKADTKKGDK